MTFPHDPHPHLSTLLDLDVVNVRSWDDPLVEQLGYDPRSGYAETFYLPIIGPSALWLLRRLAAGFDRSPEGFPLPLPVIASYLGLGHTASRHSPMRRTLMRLVDFHVARVGDECLEVRRKIAPLTQRQALRLHPSLQAALSSSQSAADLVRESETS